MSSSEAAHLRQLVRRATELIRNKLRSFEPDELRLYSRTLKKFADGFAETSASRHAKEEFVSTLRKEIRNVAKYPEEKPLMFLQRLSHFSLTAFGSTVMGTGMKNGDLDISLGGYYYTRETDRRFDLNDLATNKDLQSRVLYDVLKFLKFRQRLRMATPAFVLSRARIPILKFTDRKYGLQCDISVGNASGVLRSRVLGELLRHAPTARDLILLVKKWAKFHDLNDASRGSFGSYPLTITVLAFCKEHSYFPDIDPMLEDAVAFKRVPSLSSDRTQEPEDGTLVELVLSYIAFLSLYCSREALYDGMPPRIAVSCRGDLTDDLSDRAGRRSGVYVRDPFDLESNCAKPVSNAALQLASLQLERHFMQIVDFLTCPVEERLGQWQRLFKSFFGVALTFRKYKGTAAEKLEPSWERPLPIQQLLELHGQLIDQYFHREDARGFYRIQPKAHTDPFLQKFYEYAASAQTEPVADKDPPLAAQAPLFNVNENPVAVPSP